MSAPVESQETPITKAIEGKVIDRAYLIGGVVGGLVGLLLSLANGLGNDAVLTVPEVVMTTTITVISFGIGALEAEVIARSTIEIIKENLPKKDLG